MTSPISGAGAQPPFEHGPLRRPERTKAESEQADGAPNVPGVLRNLAEGHFKGVADVRLRIAHADRIRELQLAAQQQDQRAHDARLEEAGRVLDEFVAANLTGIEEQDAAVAETVAGFKEQLAGAGAPAAVADAIEAFAASLTEVLTLPVPYVVADAIPDPQAPEIEPPTAPVDPVAELAAALRDLFAAGQSESAAWSLAPLSGPTGHGAAYEKFVAIYTSMQDAASKAVDDQPFERTA